MVFDSARILNNEIDDEYFAPTIVFLDVEVHTKNILWQGMRSKNTELKL